MKKLLILSLALLASLALNAQNNVKLKVEGPEESYNLVRVINQTNHTDFSLTVYYLKESDGKMLVDSALGTFNLKEKGDGDSVRSRTKAGQWIGVKLPDGMEDVKVVLSYKDLPFYDIVQIVLTDGVDSANPGEEF